MWGYGPQRRLIAGERLFVVNLVSPDGSACCQLTPRIFTRALGWARQPPVVLCSQQARFSQSPAVAQFQENHCETTGSA
jgi:hypothetical protein